MVKVSVYIIILRATDQTSDFHRDRTCARCPYLISQRAHRLVPVALTHKVRQRSFVKAEPELHLRSLEAALHLFQEVEPFRVRMCIETRFHVVVINHLHYKMPIFKTSAEDLVAKVREVFTFSTDLFVRVGSS